MKNPTTITNTFFGVIAIAGACLLLTSCGDPGGTHQGESAPKIETASAPSGVPHAPDNSPVVTGTVTKKTFDPLKHVSGIFPNSSRQSDVTASFGNPETVETATGGVVRTKLGVLPYGGERVLKYDSVGLRFSIHRDDVDQADPVINEVNASRNYSGTSKIGLRIGMDKDSAVELCKREYDFKGNADETYFFRHRGGEPTAKKGEVGFTLDFRDGKLVNIRVYTFRGE